MLRILKFNYFHAIIFLQLIVEIILNNCPLENPIEVNGQCTFNCPNKENYKNKTCTINNEIIKTQFPNDIISIGNETFRYLNFITLSTGDMIFQTFSFPHNYKRIFYGLKNNGRGYFINENINEETPFYSITTDKYEKLESGNSIFVKDNKEYFLSMGYMYSFTEIIDLKKERKIISEQTSKLMNNMINHNLVTNLIKIDLNSNKYLFAGLIKYKNDIYYSKIIIINLSIQGSQLNCNIDKNQTELLSFGKFGSCFVTEERNIIICFYGKKTDSNLSFYILAYDLNLNSLNYTEYKDSGIRENHYYYCILFKQNIGAFIYYRFETNDIHYPIIIFKEFKETENKFQNYFSDIDKIELNQYIFNSTNINNDLIKISPNKIGFFTGSIDSEIVYIIILNIFNISNVSSNIKINYYSIKIYNLFKLKLYYDLKAHIYNNFIILGASYCTQEFCSNDEHFYYSTLMLIGYPNGTDYKFDIINYLQQNNNHSIDNIIFDLSENFTIDNNIFGYVYDSIKIINISKNGSINLELLNSSKSLQTNDSILNISEKIKIIFKNNIFPCSNYKLEYSYIVTEAEYKDYEKYINYSKYIKTGNNLTEEIYNQQKMKYTGKSLYYEIFLKENLSTNCSNINCSLCFANLTCITYRPYIEVSTIPITEEITYTIIETNEIIIENLNIAKNELDISKVINETEIGKNYKLIGKDFILKIKPTNSSAFDNSTYVNFYECEQLLRNEYNISNDTIITFFQLELDNNDEKTLINQVEYMTYDDKKKILNLSICKELDIEIIHLIKEDINLDKLSISYFKDLGIDIFNIKESFFNDLCYPFRASKNDIILEDRIKYIFQNYSLCDEGCEYNNINIENMTISCNCKVKENITTIIKPLNFQKEKKISLLDSNIGVVKCYNLVFSWKDKLINIGFWIFLILNIINIIIIIFYFSKGIEPVLKYLFDEMAKNGYLKNNNNLISKNKKVTKRESKKQKSLKTNKQISNPIRRKKNEENKSKISIRIKKRNKTFKKLNNKSIKGKEESMSMGNLKSISKYNSIIKNTKSNKKRKNKKYLTNISTTGNKTNQNKKGNNIINFSLINININNFKDRTPKNSNQTLHNYTFDEAIKYDRRDTLNIFYIFLLWKQIIFHTFFLKSPLELFSLRFCLFIFTFSLDLFLNSLFYFNDNISKKYEYTKGLFLFTFTNNYTIILLSTFASFILIPLIIKLSNFNNEVRNIFRNEEEKLKKNKNYKITEKRKKEILLEIEKILKKFKIKIIVFFIIEIILIIFFWYFVTAFCHVYSNTQKSWLLDSFLSILSRIVIELLFGLLFAKLYCVSVLSSCYYLYRILLFLYDFSCN